LLSLLLFGGVFKCYLREKKNLRFLVFMMVGVAFFEALYGLVQALMPTLGVLWADVDAYLGDSRGTFINRNHFAGFIEMVWPLGLGLAIALPYQWRKDGFERKGFVKRLKVFLASDRIGHQLLLWAGLLFILLALLFSKSRAGITGAFIGFATFVALTHLGGRRFSWPAWIAIGFGSFFLLFYASVIGFEEIVGRFLLIDTHAGSRMDIWTDTIGMIKDHPLGVGLANYEYVMPVYNAHGPLGIKYTHAHNDYLQILAEVGLPAFFLIVGGFYVFLGCSIARIVKYGKDMDAKRFFIGIGACCGLISIAFHSFFDFNLQIPANLLYFVVLISLVYSCVWEEKEVVK